MRTIEVSRKARFAVVIGMILTLGLGGCVVHERSERAVPYPVEVGRRSQPPFWGGPPPRWRADRPRWHDEYRRYEHRGGDRRFDGRRPYEDGGRWGGQRWRNDR